LRLATWKEFDLDAGVWTIPANRMKMRRPHRIPLASQTISVLEELRTLTGQFELKGMDMKMMMPSPNDPPSTKGYKSAMMKMMEAMPINRRRRYRLHTWGGRAED
jgi:integrase